ncbi:MAG: hypothetical protein UU10_C0029G0004 [Parcubacteria group bacterium GW2011_GWF1_40_6]|uniref:Protein containing YHS domain protein n=2 Tax=Candidatus Nomuraibacteriota TaxID=1752729 RepID=A0A0G0T3K9_9BACT|nr:MAG: hypothetical protein UT78_C0022G0023 [Candidatus Nomurabacteria bacterium GW2011_GWF2_40_12]KKR68219.1 MAG: hypothetical protein UU10_C0029G0004 [Parcubacteria group bacterium GW2011_GWF1_40_6]OGJ09336.1 MAG: hypothetical protein A2356_00565 [Candidatus Nomurabacteria bacterium RIFOXYB1_FULL_39_16]OGJ14746.1 MAG: hypothetical protein A2585_00905 [Candidatus Nomurabacteria bacterium RIFOXYD1_FULL_39_12]
MDQSLKFLQKHGHSQIKICVSGAAETGHCGLGALEKAKELGREIARQGAVLVTGATTGFPLWVAMGTKEEGGVSVGISPAANEREHAEVYKLPLDYMDLIIYTGFGYPGRDLLLTRSADAVICGCGRIGTIHEFTIAFEDGKPIGIFEGPWEMGNELKEILEKSNRPNAKIAAGDDPKKLLEEVIALVKKDKVTEYKIVKDSVSDAQ